MIGQRFNKVIVVSEGERKSFECGKSLKTYICKCDCGKTLSIYACKLKLVKSCGCSKKYHGLSKTPEYKAYSAMFNRVNSDSGKFKKSYSDIGVVVCPRWSEGNGAGFLNFLTDMGKKPTKGHSLDRINPYLGYDPSNCRWADANVQAINKRVKETSVFRGVQETRFSSWNAKISYLGKQYAKRFKTKEEAIQWRKDKEVELLGCTLDTPVKKVDLTPFIPKHLLEVVQCEDPFEEDELSKELGEIK